MSNLPAPGNTSFSPATTTSNTKSFLSIVVLKISEAIKYIPASASAAFTKSLAFSLLRSLTIALTAVSKPAASNTASIDIASPIIGAATTPPIVIYKAALNIYSTSFANCDSYCASLVL